MNETVITDSRQLYEFRYSCRCVNKTQLTAGQVTQFQKLTGTNSYCVKCNRFVMFLGVFKRKEN